MRRRLRPLGFALFAAAAAFWVVLLRPTFLGGSTSYVIVSGHSMEPTLGMGDIAVVRRQARYGRGDVIAFRVDGGRVIHRIVGSTRTGYVTRGDNRGGADLWRPKVADIDGKMWVHVPKAGFAIAYVRRPLPLAFLGGVLGALLVLGGGRRVRPA